MKNLLPNKHILAALTVATFVGSIFFNNTAGQYLFADVLQTMSDSQQEIQESTQTQQESQQSSQAESQTPDSTEQPTQQVQQESTQTTQQLQPETSETNLPVTLSNLETQIANTFTEDYKQGEATFEGHQKNGKVEVSKDKIAYQFVQVNEERRKQVQAEIKQHPEKRAELNKNHDWVKTARFNVQFQNSNQSATVVGDKKLNFHSNYYVGNNRNNWKTNVDNFENVAIKELYSNIDLKFYSTQDLKYDLIVHPQGQPSQIKFTVDGVDALEIAPNGDLKLTTNLGEIFKKKPVCYQENSTGRINIECQYSIENQKNISFITANYDQTKDLIIDPPIEYSSFAGSTDEEISTSIDTDSFGNTYILTNSQNTSTGNAYIVVYKINSTGSLDYFSFIDGSDYESASNLTVTDSTIYFGGSSLSPDYPVTLPIGNLPAGPFGQEDFIVTQLDTATGNLIYSTYFGDTNDDGSRFNFFDIDQNGNMYIYGDTETDCLGTIWGPGGTLYDCDPGALFDGYATIIAKIFADGSDIQLLTYIQSAKSIGKAMQIDSLENVYVSGNYDGASGIGQTDGISAFVDQDGFLIKLSNDFTTENFVYSLGGQGADSIDTFTIDSNDNFIIAGSTVSDDLFSVIYPILTSYSPTRNNFTGFIIKLDQTLNFINATFFDKEPTNIQVDSNDVIYTTGTTYDDITTTDGSYLSTRPGCGQCGFITKLSSNLEALSYSSYFTGAETNASINKMLITSPNHITISGTIDGLSTSTSDFPTTIDAFQPNYNGDIDGYVTKFETIGSTVSLGFVTNPITSPVDSNISVEIEVLRVNSDTGEFERNTDDNTSVVNLTLQGGSPGATLSGTTSMVVTNGLASFSNLQVNTAGTNYSLQASL